MTTPDKKVASTGANQVEAREKEATVGILSTATGAILMLTAFAVIPDPTLRLVVVSLGGWMIGGSC